MSNLRSFDIYYDIDDRHVFLGKFCATAHAQNLCSAQTLLSLWKICSAGKVLQLFFLSTRRHYVARTESNSRRERTAAG